MIKSLLNKIFIFLLLLGLSAEAWAAKVICQQQGAAISVAASTTRYMQLGCNTRISDDFTTENDTEITYRTAGTFSNLYINILTNDRNTSTFRTRKNNANASMTLSITTATTGKFEDTTNTDAVTAGDEWNYILTTGSGGTVFTFKIAQCIFQANSDTVIRTASGGGPGNVTSASSTLIQPSAGDGPGTITVDSTLGITYRIAGTLSNLFAEVGSNARTTTTTFRSRVNSGNGNMTFSVTASSTGLFEDTTNSDSIAIDDLVNFSITTGTGTEILSLSSMAADFTTTNNKTMYSAAADLTQTVNASVTTYYPFAGALRTSTTESDMIAEANLKFIASLLQCNISSNTVSANSTLRFRKNSGNGNQVVTITASTTGVFQDTTNTDFVQDSDEINYQLVTGGSGTSLVIRSISVLGETQRRFLSSG